jgi:hypothetical protein
MSLWYGNFSKGFFCGMVTLEKYCSVAYIRYRKPSVIKPWFKSKFGSLYLGC